MKKIVALTCVMVSGLLSPVLFSAGPYYWSPRPPGVVLTGSRCWKCWLRDIPNPVASRDVCSRTNPSNPDWECREAADRIGCESGRHCEALQPPTNVWYIVPLVDNELR